MPALVLWVLSGKIARRIARPLDELVHVSTEIGRGNLAARADLACGGLDEIAILARSINDMAARIERQIADQRELLAGVSHELRTPLARLRVLLDIARDQGTSPRTWDELERELLEMDRLVGELLASARLDFQALTPRAARRASTSAARALERAGVPADKLVSEAADRALRGRPHPGGARAGQPARQRRQARRRARSAAGAASRPGFVVFEVVDRGPGFPPALLEKLFHPFVQSAPGSPARATAGRRWAWGWPWWPGSRAPTAARSGPRTATAAARGSCSSWPSSPLPRPA